jgi:CRP/FNR family transcriptional regulator, cyclic AMP receptor protein
VTELNAVSAGAVCSVLHEDPDLAEAVPDDRRDQAISELSARELRLPAGPWSGEHLPVIHEGIGLLILKGMMIRRVGLEGRYGAELLGECDILRPWQGEDGGSATLATTTGWSVLAPTRIAVLDAQFARQMARYPELAGRLIGRALQRSRHLTVNMAIVHQARVDIRLHMLMWHLAGRWGRVRSDGTMLPVRLTHASLADLVAARRPTVTSALSDLTRRGFVRLVDDGWLLSGEPPGELLDVAGMAMGRIG